MTTYMLLGGSIIVGLALLEDASGTMKLVTAVITVRGVTWIAKKVAESLDKDKAQIINYTGWCMTGVSLVGLLKNARLGVEPVIASMQKVGETVVKASASAEKMGISIDKISNVLGNFAEWIEKLPGGLN